MRTVLVMFVVTRLALAAVVFLATASFTSQPCPACGELSEVAFLAGLAHWDGVAYLDIARNWYEGAATNGNAAFFPFYPLLMRIGGALLGGSNDAYLIAGIVTSNSALAVATVVLARLAASKLDAASARRAAATVLLFPTTIFLSAVYADALFLALAVTAGLAAQHGRWWRSGFLAAAAALTRPFGILALVPLGVCVLRARSARGALALAPAPAAYAAWLAYLYAVTGDPLAVFHGYTSGFVPRAPLQSFTDLLDPSVYGFPWFVAGLFAVSAVLVLLSWRIAGAEHAAYATAMFVLIAAAGSLTSSMRYELSIYPAFLSLGWLTRAPVARVVWLATSGLLAIVFAAMFALGYWVS